MSGSLLYFSKIHSTPLPPPPTNGTQESSKVQQMCIKLTCRTTTALMITSMLPCARWAVSLESGATCNIAESSTANKSTNSLTLSLSLSLSLSHSLNKNAPPMNTILLSSDCWRESPKRSQLIFTYFYFSRQPWLESLPFFYKMTSVQNKGCVTLWPCHLH